MKFWQSINFKLLILFLTVCSFVLITGIIGIVNINKLSKESNHIFFDDIPILKALYYSKIELEKSIECIYRSLLIKDIKDIDKIREDEGAFRENVINFNMYIAAIVWGSESNIFKQSSGGLTFAMWEKKGLKGKLIIKDNSIHSKIVQIAGKADIHFAGFYRYAKKLMASNKKAIRLGLLNKTSKANEIKNKLNFYLKKTNKYKKLTIQNLNDLIKIIEEETDQAISLMAVIKKITIKTLISILLISFFLSILVGLIFSKIIIIKPIKLLTEGTNALKKGKLDYKIPIKTKDEIGQLAYSFNEMTEELDKSRLDSLAAIEELKDFFYVVSHDMKAPLRSINQISEWLLADYSEKVDEEGKKLLNLISKRSVRMHKFIEGFVQYSNLIRSKENNIIQQDLNICVKKVIDEICIPDNIFISVKDKLPSLKGEKKDFEQLFTNLISNAIEFNDKSIGKIEISCIERNKYWEFAIADNGIGIDKKYFKKIFQIFQTLTLRDERESTGIGLTIVKKIIDIYEGSIWVDSELTKGATFYFMLPK